MQLTNGENLKKAVLTAPIGICILDAETLDLEIVNEKFLQISRNPYEAVIGRFYWDAFPETRVFNEKALTGVVDSGEVYYADEVELNLMRHGDEELVFVTFVYAPIKDNNGKVVKIAVWVLENAQEVNKRRAITASEERLRALVNATSDVIYSLSPDWEVMNQLDGRGFLKSTNEPIRGWRKQNVYPDDMEMVNQTIDKAIREKKIFELEHRVLRADGTPGWTFSRAVPILDEQNNIVEWFGTASDITERKQIEAALREAREQSDRQKRVYETITSGTPDLMYVWDLNYRFTYVNSALLNMWGKSWDDAIGKGLRENGYEEWHAQMHEREIDHVVATKESVRGEVAFPHATLGKRIYDYILIPMLFYYKGRVRNGWINICNVFRGTMVIGTPGSGKSFSIVNPFIRQLIDKEFAVCLYDFKFPDLGHIAYYHYLLAKQKGKLKGFAFHVINLNDIEKSRRINPWRADYIRSLADAAETAEALVEALKKGDRSGGSDQFFTQSAINFLASCVYFMSKYKGGIYSSFPHVLALLNRSYEEIFNALTSEPELRSLLSPFMTAYNAKAFDQLEGQIGTLKIFISRLATKETYWVFSGNDFDLKISAKENPGMLVLANDPNTQNINSACYSIIINRLTKLINTKGNLPSALIVDEVPTLFVHRVENLIATARSNKVAVLMGLQELPQFNQQYGKDTAATITAVVGTVLSGSVRNKDTLEWLERLFGKSKQLGEGLSIDRNKTSTSLNEKLEALIPAGKIASLNSGEMVGVIAADAQEKFTGQFETSAVNCRINLDMEAIKREERGYKPLPAFYDFGGNMEEKLRQNFNHISQEIQEMVLAFRPAAPDAPAKATMKK